MKTTQKRILALFMALLMVMLMTSCGSSTSEADNTTAPTTKKPTAQKEEVIDHKTLMIYLVGSDLESESGAATLDMEEIKASGVDTEKNTVLVYTGGAKMWYSDIPVDANCVYRLDGSELVLEKSDAAASMGESDTLSTFLKYGLTEHPADRYGVILWNHGAGPLIGYGVDEVFDNDLLTMQELSDAFRNAGIDENNKMEFVGFDACLMGSLETAWMMKDYARYMIASQELEPGWGWDYSFLSTLNQEHDGDVIGKAIVDTYIEAGTTIMEENTNLTFDLTLSCLDLSKIAQVETELNTLFEEVDKTLDAGELQSVVRNIVDCKVFGAKNSLSAYDLVDLKEMAENLDNDTTLIDALDAFVCYNRTTVDGANGVSIYHPYSNVGYSDQFIATLETFDMAPSYVAYMQHLLRKLAEPTTFGNVTRSQYTTEKKADTYELSFELTEEQQKSFMYAEYLIMKETDYDGTYHVAYVGDMGQPDGNGVLSAKYSNQEGVIVDGGVYEQQETTPVTLEPIRDGGNSKRYVMRAKLLKFGDGETTEDVEEDVYWHVYEKNGSLQLGQIYRVEDVDSLIPPKGTLDYKDYDAVMFMSVEIWIDDGTGVTMTAYESPSAAVLTMDEFHAEFRTVDTSEYVYRIRLCDVSGNWYETEILPLG